MDDVPESVKNARRHAALTRQLEELRELYDELQHEHTVLIGRFDAFYRFVTAVAPVTSDPEPLESGVEVQPALSAMDRFLPHPQPVFDWQPLGSGDKFWRNPMGWSTPVEKVPPKLLERFKNGLPLTEEENDGDVVQGVGSAGSGDDGQGNGSDSVPHPEV